MKAILKNYWGILCRYFMVTGLNLLGLAAAFVAFMLILMQVSFEFGYDEFRPDSDRIYRVETEDEGQYKAYIDRPLAERVMAASPNIERGGLQYRQPAEVRFSYRDGQGGVSEQKTLFNYVSSSFADVMQLEMVEGTASLDDLSQVLIPRSMASALFGKKSALGERIEILGEFPDATHRRDFFVGGVYRDIPANSLLRNSFFVNEGDTEAAVSWSNHRLYVRLDDPASKAGVEDLFTRVRNENKPPERHANVRLTLLSDVYFTKDYHRTQVNQQPLGNKNATYLFLALAVLILGVAIINFFNFLVAQAPFRIHSVNMQKVLGSPLKTLRVGMLLESVFFCEAAYLLSLFGLFVVEKSSLMNYMQVGMAVTGNLGLLAAGLVIAMLVGVIAGLYPVLYTTSLPPAMTLKGSFGLSFYGRRVRTALIGFQYVVSIALILASAFMNLQSRFLHNQPLGFDQHQVLMLPVSDKLLEQRQTLAALLERNPAVSQVSFSSLGFFGNANDENWGLVNPRDPDHPIQIHVRHICSDFLPMMDIPVSEGRNYTAADELKKRGDPTLPVIVNRTAQEVYGLEVGDRIENREVIGVIEDFHYNSLHKAVEPILLVPVSRQYRGARGIAYLKVNGGNYKELMANVTAAARSLDPYSDAEPYFLDQHIRRLYESDSQRASLITFFSLLAILISLSGVFSLVSFETRHKRKEIGVRRVFGATVREILAWFNRVYVRVVLVCFVVAAPLAWYAMQQWRQGFTVKVPMYWWVFALVLLAVGSLTSLTVTWLSYRVATDHPVKALRSE